MADDRTGEPERRLAERLRTRGRGVAAGVLRSVALALSWRRSASTPDTRASSVRRRGGGRHTWASAACVAAACLVVASLMVLRRAESPGPMPGASATTARVRPEPGPVGGSGRPGRREQHRGGRRRSVGRCDARAEAMGLSRSRRPSGHRDVAGQFAVEDAGGEGAAVVVSGSGEW